MLNFSEYLPRKSLDFIHTIARAQGVANGYILQGINGSLLPLVAQYFIATRHCVGEAAPCGTCTPCMRDISQNKIDIYHCSSEKAIGIEQVRQISEWIVYGPTEHPTLFVVIHHAETMTIEAANSFLKTLEEPPKNVCFLLLTQNAHQLLDTIKSRCQTLDIPGSSPTQLLKFIQDTMTDIPEEILSHYSTSLSVLDFFIENHELPEHRLLDFNSLHQLSPESTITYTQALSKNKAWVTLQCHFWLEEIVSQPTVMSHQGDLIVEKLKQLKYNLNVRLQLEDLINHLV